MDPEKIIRFIDFDHEPSSSWGSYSGEEIVIQTNLALQWDMNVIEWVLNHRECANWNITIFHEINSKSLNQVGLGLFANCEIINDGG